MTSEPRPAGRPYVVIVGPPRSGTKALSSAVRAGQWIAPFGEVFGVPVGRRIGGVVIPTTQGRKALHEEITNDPDFDFSYIAACRVYDKVMGNYVDPARPASSIDLLYHHLFVMPVGMTPVLRPVIPTALTFHIRHGDPIIHLTRSPVDVIASEMRMARNGLAHQFTDRQTRLTPEQMNRMWCGPQVDDDALAQLITVRVRQLVETQRLVSSLLDEYPFTVTIDYSELFEGQVVNPAVGDFLRANFQRLLPQAGLDPQTVIGDTAILKN